MASKSEYRNGWIAEKLDRINLTVPKGKKDTIKAHAEAQGESVNGFINRAIDETMERDKSFFNVFDEKKRGNEALALRIKAIYLDQFIIGVAHK